MKTLEQAMMAFLEQRLGGECIDRLPLTADQQKLMRADFLLLDRSVIVEVKDLDDDRVAAARRVIEEWRARPDWPVINHEIDIQDALRLHRDGRRINDQLTKYVTASVEDAIERANRQIRDTKGSFGIPKARGILVLLNQDVDLLDPKVLGAIVGRTLSKRVQAEFRYQFRYLDLDSILVFTWAHTVRDKGSPSEDMPVLIVTKGCPALPAAEDSVEGFLVRQWAAFMGKPFLDGGLLSDPDQVRAWQIRGKRPPVVI